MRLSLDGVSGAWWARTRNSGLLRMDVVCHVAPHPRREGFMAAVARGEPVGRIARRWGFEPGPLERARALARRLARALLRR